MSTLDELTDAAEQRWISGLAAGPDSARMRYDGVGVGADAPDLALPDSTGSECELSSFWSERPAYFIFWRHFGCGCGADRADRLREERAALKELGVTAVPIGMGDPVRAAAYEEQFGIDETFLCDPERLAYGAYGVPEGNILATSYDEEEIALGGPEGWQMVVNYKRANNMRLVDNGWQLMSEFVVDTSGKIRMAYRYQYCDNFPDSRLALSAIKEADAGLDPFRGSLLPGG